MLAAAIFFEANQEGREAPIVSEGCFFHNDHEITAIVEIEKGQRGLTDSIGNPIEPDEEPTITFLSFIDLCGGEYSELDFPVLFIELLIEEIIENTFA